MHHVQTVMHHVFWSVRMTQEIRQLSPPRLMGGWVLLVLLRLTKVSRVASARVLLGAGSNKQGSWFREARTRTWMLIEGVGGGLGFSGWMLFSFKSWKGIQGLALHVSRMQSSSPMLGATPSWFYSSRSPSSLSRVGEGRGWLCWKMLARPRTSA